MDRRSVLILTGPVRCAIVPTNRVPLVAVPLIIPRQPQRMARMNHIS
jgi:hypothetical protein